LESSTRSQKLKQTKPVSL